MKRLLPQSLFGQTLLVLLAGLIVSHAIGWWIYTADREQAVRAVGGFAAAQRVANLTRLVQEMPPEWRQRLISALSDQTLRVSLSAKPPELPGLDQDSGISRTIRDFLIEQAALKPDPQPRVAVSPAREAPFAGRHPMAGGPMMGRGHMFGPGPMMHGLGGFRDLQVAMPLPNGQWLLFATTLPDTGPAFSRQFLVSMIVMAIIILGIAVWVMRRVTAPLTSVALAAERLGRDITAPALAETGTIETRRASRAFNGMQTSLRNLIENRTQLLAAISHDLRTPLTLLRLRVENVENPGERDKMLASIADMNAMIETTLNFARDDAVTEPTRPTDIAALLESIADDMRDAGFSVTMQPAAPVIYACRPAALKRALTNLIDNAVKFGRSAHTSIHTRSTEVEITIDDEGPGIPESDLKRVFEPFYRVESSRSRETGGIGLGLAIARTIVHTHGGELALSNRPTGGLRVTLTLPRHVGITT